MSSRRSRPNIVVIGIDTLRPDHLGCYGYHRPTSPHIDALAEESVVFETAIAAGIPTTPSFTTLLTGLHPYRHRIVSHPPKRRLPEGTVLLPELAQRAGYRTVACDNLVVQAAGRASWFTRGYEEYSGFSYAPFGDQSAQLTDRALGFVAENGDRPLFLFLHYWDPHTPYGPRPPYDTMHYEPGSGPVDLADVRAIRPEYYDAFLGEMRLRHPDDYAYVVAQYDGEVSQVDHEVGRLVSGLRELGAWDDTILLLLSDHGECFGEGDFYFDHHGLYDAVTRIALLLRVPGQSPTRVASLVSHEDLLPTLGELAGLETPAYPLSGTSLLPLLSGADAVRERVISAECTRQASLALRTARHKLIVPIVEDAEGAPIPDFYGRPRRPDPLLFDLAADPGETHDLAPTRPRLVAEMRAELDAWAREMEQPAGEPDPIRAQGLGLPYEGFMSRMLARAARQS